MKKHIHVHGQMVQLELRICANPGCSMSFWTNEASNHSICGKRCWELVNNRGWQKKAPMPPIRRVHVTEPELFAEVKRSSVSRPLKTPAHHEVAPAP